MQRHPRIEHLLLPHNTIGTLALSPLCCYTFGTPLYSKISWHSSCSSINVLLSVTVILTLNSFLTEDKKWGGEEGYFRTPQNFDMKFETPSAHTQLLSPPYLHLYSLWLPLSFFCCCWVQVLYIWFVVKSLHISIP